MQRASFHGAISLICFARSIFHYREIPFSHGRFSIKKDLGFVLHLIKAEYSINNLPYKFVTVSAMSIYISQTEKEMH